MINAHLTAQENAAIRPTKTKIDFNYHVSKCSLQYYYLTTTKILRATLKCHSIQNYAVLNLHVRLSLKYHSSYNFSKPNLQKIKEKQKQELSLFWWHGFSDIPHLEKIAYDDAKKVSNHANIQMYCSCFKGLLHSYCLQCFKSILGLQIV